MKLLTLEIRSALMAGILLLSSVSPVFAVDVPSFPTCPNPSGVQIASYADGTHGIPGRVEVFTGSDNVFRIDESRVVQCYCAPDGNGIQTNWWKVSSLTSEEKAELVKQGWIYIPDGSVWGLNQGDWMAQNFTLSCGDKGGGSSSNSNSSSSSTSTTTTIVNTITNVIPQILGFADTGRQRFYRGVISFAGITFISFGILILAFNLKEKKK